MVVNLDHLPVLDDDFPVDRIDSVPVREISYVYYKYKYPSDREVRYPRDREVRRRKVLMVFGTNSSKDVLYGCHTLEEEGGYLKFNFIGGDQNSLLQIPVDMILNYSPLK
jgi:hypothetical protein